MKRIDIHTIVANSVCSIIRRFIDARAGMAAVEFALILPVLILLFFGVVESSDALSNSRKVTLAANTLADLAAQETDLLTSAADDLFDGVEQIIGTNGASATIRLISVIVDDDDPVVHWSRDNSGGEPYAPGDDYNDLPNAALLDSNASIIVAEIDYSYTSNLTQFIIPSVNFEKLATRWPRRALRVQLCISAGNCTS